MNMPRIAIVGAGFTGSSLAMALARHAPGAADIQLIDPSPARGPGLAHGTARESDLLNVPAGRMSAFPDRPAHFLDWLRNGQTAGTGPEAGDFVPRRLYGHYIRACLDEFAAGVRSVRGAVTGIAPRPEGLLLRFADGQSIAADIAVIATGNAPPSPPPLADGTGFATAAYVNDPWRGCVADDLPRDATVLTIGTGLTMADTVMHLLDRGHTGSIVALSRRGYVPLPHTAAGQHLAPVVTPAGPRAMLRSLRDAVARANTPAGAEAGAPWQSVIDSVRPITQDIWRGWTGAEKAAFLRHPRAVWDIHRHRLPPRVAARLEAARNSGQLRIAAGRLTHLTPRGDGLDAGWRERRTGQPREIHAARVINCTGPETNVARSADPLIRDLLASGLARPCATGLGFDTADNGALKNAAGIASDRLFGAGPVCRPALWEITAVPDIRVQTDRLARMIAGSTMNGAGQGG